jgi:hypothetical protein
VTSFFVRDPNGYLSSFQRFDVPLPPPGARPPRERAAFEGFGPAVTDWFVALASDNSRAYWAATRDIWQRDVRAPLEALLAEAAAEAGGRVKLFRPYRDLRFGGAEAPMKTAAGGLVLPPAGPRPRATSRSRRRGSTPAPATTASSATSWRPTGGGRGRRRARPSRRRSTEARAAAWRSAARS